MEAATYFTGVPCKRGHIAPRRRSDRGCIECVRLKVAAYQAAHRDRMAKSYASYRAANRDKMRVYAAERRAAHPEKHRAIKAATRTKNREKIRAAHVAWCKANAEPCAAHAATRRARKRAAPGRGISSAQRREIINAALGLCAYCNERRPLALDHIEPLVRGGAHDPENIAPACKSCNSAKGDSPLLVWLALRSAQQTR